MSGKSNLWEGRDVSVLISEADMVFVDSGGACIITTVELTVFLTITASAYLRFKNEFFHILIFYR